MKGIPALKSQHQNIDREKILEQKAERVKAGKYISDLMYSLNLMKSVDPANFDRSDGLSFNLYNFLSFADGYLSSVRNDGEYLEYFSYVKSVVSSHIDTKQWAGLHQSINQFNGLIYKDDSKDHILTNNLIRTRETAMRDLSFMQNINSFFNDTPTILFVDEYDVSGMSGMNKSGENFSVSKVGKKIAQTLDIDDINIIARATGDSSLNIISSILNEVERIIQERYLSEEFSSLHDKYRGIDTPVLCKFYNFGGDDIQSIRCGPEGFWKAVGGVNFVTKEIQNRLQHYKWKYFEKPDSSIDAIINSSLIATEMSPQMKLARLKKSKKFDITLRNDSTNDLGDLKIHEGASNEDGVLINNFNAEQRDLSGDNKLRSKFFSATGVVLDTREVLSFLKGERLVRTMSGEVYSHTEIGPEDQSNVNFYNYIQEKISKSLENKIFIQKLYSINSFDELSEAVKNRFGSASPVFRHFKKIFRLGSYSGCKDGSNEKHFTFKKRLFLEFLGSYTNKSLDRPVLSFSSLKEEYIKKNVLALGFAENAIKIANSICINQGEQTIEATINTLMNYIHRSLTGEVYKGNETPWIESIKNGMLKMKGFSDNSDANRYKQKLDKFFDKDIRLEITKNGLDFGFAFIIDDQSFDRGIASEVTKAFEFTGAPAIITSTISGVNDLEHIIPVVSHSRSDLYTKIFNNPRTSFRTLVGRSKELLKKTGIKFILYDIFSDVETLNILVENFGSPISKREFGSKIHYSKSDVISGYFQKWNNRSYDNISILIDLLSDEASEIKFLILSRGGENPWEIIKSLLDTLERVINERDDAIDKKVLLLAKSKQLSEGIDRFIKLENQNKLPSIKH